MRVSISARFGQVILGQVDGVMGQVVVRALDAQVEHERGAGELLAGDLAVGPAAPQVVGDQPGHGAGEVGVDHQGVGVVDARSRSHADRAPALEEDLLHLVVQRDRGAQLLGRAGHRLGDRAAAADGMIDAVLVLQERQDREQAGAVERRHAQVLRLERHGQPDPRVVEVAAQLAVERQPGPEQRKHLQQLRREQVAPAQEGRFQDAPELVHLDPIVVQEAAEVGPRRAARGRRSPVPSGRTSGVACSSPPAPKTR